MPTTFSSIHLPMKTIDAIRTMISLPLLYPKAFEEGLLKYVHGLEIIRDTNMNVVGFVGRIQ